MKENEKIKQFMNINEMILKIMSYEDVYTDTDLAKILGLKNPSAISNWKRTGRIPSKYLIKYKDVISGVASHKPGQPAQISEPNMEYKNKMEVRGDYGYYIQEGRLHRCNLKTGNVFIEVKGVWVDKSTL